MVKLGKDEVFGPVREIRNVGKFITVGVPMWHSNADPGDRNEVIWTKSLVWVNVFHKPSRIQFAHKVRSDELADWKRHGWVDHWLDVASDL